MTLLWHRVAPPLNAYVNFLYQEQWSSAVSWNRIFPMPAIDLKINLGDPLRVLEPDRPPAVCTDSWCVGLWSRHHVVEWPRHTRFVAVSFKPGGAHAFLGVPMSELQNGIAPLDALWGRFAEEVRERLHDLPTPEQRFEVFEEILLTRLREPPEESPMVDHVLRRIAERRGAVRVGSLCEEIGITGKHLTTLFKRVVGCTPKQLARLHRFGHIVETVDVTRPVDWTSIAHANDYFDQSHFNHDFEAHTGLTPSAYLAQRRLVDPLWPHEAFALGVHPAG